MAYIPVPNAVQVDLFQLWDNQQVENVLHFQPSIPLTPTLYSELAAHLVTWWNANLKVLMPTTLQLSQIKVTDLTTQFSPVLNYSTGLPIVGTTASASLPGNCALVITKRTALRGRSFRGRIYQPGMVEAVVTNSQVAAGTVTAFLNAYGLIRTFSTASATWDMGVVSRVQGGVPLAVGEFHDITSFTSEGVIDSQRRRLPGRGA